jgi:long-chain acyl-CoA synthetase
MYGHSLKDFVVGVIVLDPERLAAHAKKVGKDPKDESLIEELRPIVDADLKALAAHNKFNSLEKPKQLILLTEPFSIENGILTPTMKIKRNIAAQVYAA